MFPDRVLLLELPSRHIPFQLSEQVFPVMVQAELLSRYIPSELTLEQVFPVMLQAELPFRNIPKLGPEQVFPERVLLLLVRYIPDWEFAGQVFPIRVLLLELLIRYIPYPELVEHVLLVRVHPELPVRYIPA